MTKFYLGPYLVIPPTPVRSSRQERTCSNNCSSPAIAKPAKFCGNCGGAIIESTVPSEKVKPLSIYRLSDRWRDYMHCPEYGQNHPKGEMWLPNHSGHGITLEPDTEDGFTPVLFSTIDGAAMLEKAQRFYGEFVDALKNDFDIEPRWEVGLVAYND